MTLNTDTVVEDQLDLEVIQKSRSIFDDPWISAGLHTIGAFITAYTFLSPYNKNRYPILNYMFIFVPVLFFMIFQSLSSTTAYIKLENKKCERNEALYKMVSGVVGYLLYLLIKNLKFAKLWFLNLEINRPAINALIISLFITIPIFLWTRFSQLVYKRPECHKQDNIKENFSTATKVTGTIMYQPQIILPYDAIIDIIIEDLSLKEASIVISRQRILTKGDQIPIPFEISYDTNLIKEKHDYNLGIIIKDGLGRLLYMTHHRIPIITHSNRTTDINVMVDHVR